MDSSGFGDQRKRFRSLNNIVALAADAVMAVVFAPACASCASVLESPLDGPVCSACWRGIGPLPLPWVPPPPSAIDAAAAAAAFDGTLRNIIHAWKFERRQTLGGPLAAIVRDRCASTLAGADVAVPVPITPWRRWHRGFNQAEDLARGLGLPVAGALARWRPRPAQVTLPSRLRRHNLDTSIFVLPHRRTRVAGRIVVLVDDVVTTGATLEACAAALKEAGAAEVRAVTAAQTLLRRP